MRIVVFKYGPLLPTETFIRSHIDHIAGGYEGFMHLANWNTPQLGHRPLWKTDVFSGLFRKLWIKTGHDRTQLHAKAFASALKKSKASAVLAEFGYSGVAALELCHKLHIPLVVHFHGTDVNRKSVVEKYLSDYKRLFSYAARLVAVSEHMKTILVEMTADPEKISVIPCGALLPPKCALDMRPDGEYNIISVTRMADVKAPHLTILAYHKYLSKGGEGHLHMVGDGPLLPSCLSLTRGLGIADNVTFHGGVQHEKVLEMLGRSFMYVQHSVVAADGDCEGMPVSIMEAAGYGLPIVATSHGGIPELIEHAQNGYLVEEYDMDGMAHYMYELWRNTDKAMMMGRNARIKAEAEYDVKRQSEKLKKLILSTLTPQLRITPAE